MEVLSTSRKYILHDKDDINQQARAVVMAPLHTVENLFGLDLNIDWNSGFIFN